MPTPCKVCGHLRRAEIDLRLAKHRVNVSAVAAEYGLNRRAVARHKEQHLSGFLKVYGADAMLPTVGQLHGEYLRLHSAALDALALAEAGTLHAVDSDGREHRRVSPTAIAAAIREGRMLLDSITSLAADAADEHERPAGIAQGELTQRVASQLSALMARAAPSLPAASAVEDAAADSGPDLAASAAADTPGRVAAAWGRPSPPQISLDAAMALPEEADIIPNPPLEVETSALSEEAARVVRQDAASYEHSGDREVIMSVPNPRYPGSAASSSEERAADGYPDIELTLSDLKARPDLLRRLLLEQQEAERPPTTSL